MDSLFIHRSQYMCCIEVKLPQNVPRTVKIFRRDITA